MIDFPTLGMGTAPIGNLYRVVSDAEARATLDAEIETLEKMLRAAGVDP
jgi:hypothetical protein